VKKLRADKTFIKERLSDLPVETKKKIRNIKMMMRQSSKSLCISQNVGGLAVLVNRVCELIAEVACDVLESYVGLPIVRRFFFSFSSWDVIAIGRTGENTHRRALARVYAPRVSCVRSRSPVNTAPTTIKPIHLARPDFFPAWKERY